MPLLDQRGAWHDKKEVDSDSLPALLTQVIQDMDSDSDVITELNRRHLGLYGALPMSPTSSKLITRDILSSTPKLTWNVVQSVIDTAVSFIGTNRPKPKFLTVGGTYSDRVKAENLTWFCQGVFYKTNLYSIALDVFRDATVFGTGFLKIWADIEDDQPSIRAERVFPEEIKIATRDGLYGKPQEMYQLKEVPRSNLIAQFPDHELEIDEASLITEDNTLSVFEDNVSVIEAWHLGNKSRPGRHVITTSNHTLLDEEYTKERFPILVFRYNSRPLGFFGQGIAEILTGLQIEVNLLLQKIQRLMRLATSKVFVHSTTHLNKNSLNNEDWGVVEYSGEKPPVFATINAFSPEYGQQLDRLYQKAFELSGVSQLSAQSKKPTGLSSGKALREYENIQTQRFELISQNWNTFFLDVADAVIDCAQTIHEAGKDSYEILSETPAGLKKIKWSDINMDRDAFQIQLWPVPMLTDSPADQLQTLLELSQQDPLVGSMLLDYIEHPDVKQVLSIANAGTRIIFQIGNKILSGESIPPPDPAIISPKSIALMKQLYLKAIVDGYEEDVLSKFRIWMSQVTAIIDAQNAEMQLAAQQSGMPNMPGQPGMLPEQSPPASPEAPITENMAAMNLPQ